jgi:ATP-dependent exoDNAse (exonuclease V) beta subunit
MSGLEAADALARERALDVTDSFIVQAPAGSGKTTVLTQRYLRLLTTVDEPEQVLAITFTRKAAGEMRERVQKALEGDIEVRSPADALTLELAAAVRTHAAQREWGIEDSAARLRIQTIDAFNGYLANSLPITSQNGFGRTIADAPDTPKAIRLTPRISSASSGGSTTAGSVSRCSSPACSPGARSGCPICRNLQALRWCRRSKRASPTS